MITEMVIEPIRTDLTPDGPTDVRPLRMAVTTTGPVVPGMRVVEMTEQIPVVVAVIAPSQPVADTLADIQARIADGQSTPVLASHLDALGLRDAVEAWARGS
jgi:hypothetical protein